MINNRMSFEVGSKVNHRSGGMPAEVIEREFTSEGTELLVVRDGAGRIRTFRAEGLVAG